MQVILAIRRVIIRERFGKGYSRSSPRRRARVRFVAWR
jgi:hypothetical protein